MEQIRIKNLEELEQWAAIFINNYLHISKKVLLYASMGAGKTTFVKAICKALGVTEKTASPTFALVHQYHIENSPLQVHHADLYRLKHTEEAFDIGIEDLFYDENYLFIEWPELIEPLLPLQGIIYLKIEEEKGDRIFTVEIDKKTW